MLTEPRSVYRPYLYPQAYDFFLRQQQSHWLWTEVQMTSDVKDFRERLTEDEKQVVIRILRLFTQTELTVEEYWTSKVSQWFRHPEVQQMAATFGSFEAIHISAYDHLSQTLGLPESEYQEFLHEPAMRDRQERLASILDTSESIEDRIRSLAVFSAFTEGVSLFASFATLLNFSRRGLLKGVADIVSWSSKDESLHSEGGCWLARTLIQENPSVWTDDLKKSIYQAARDAVELEDGYLEYVFKGVTVEGVTLPALKAFVRHRANTKLQDLGLKSNWRNLDRGLVNSITEWYDLLVSGKSHHDFFSRKDANYAKGVADFSKVNFDEVVYDV